MNIKEDMNFIEKIKHNIIFNYIKVIINYYFNIFYLEFFLKN